MVKHESGQEQASDNRPGVSPGERRSGSQERDRRVVLESEAARKF